MELLYTNAKNVTTKYTEEMLIDALKTRDEFDKRNQELTELTKQQIDELANIRGEVYDFFNGNYTSGDAELTFTIDEINELLESIGCLKLKSLYTVRACIDVTVTGIEAESEEAAESEFQDHISVEWGAFEGQVDEFIVDVRRVEAE